LLSSTYSNALYRGVEVEGPDRGAPPGVDGEETARDAADSRETTLELDRWFAHRYSECANIWNPIHTERTVAKQAGLPDIIVHGTALWALAGCVLISRFAPNQPQRLRRLSGRFSAMVPAGTPITIRHARAAVDPHTALFSVINAQGQEAVSGGVATFSET
jgi:acyl dehydratase